VDIAIPASSRRRSSHRYITDRFLPDKAIDLIDEALAHQDGDRLQPEEMDQLDRRLIQLKIEREAVKKERTKLRKTPGLIGEEIAARARVRPRKEI
jgi:ATP-dependent Clp protease ATP-binding subunit ClpB